MDVSQSVAPAENEPEPDSTVPIRSARLMTGMPSLTSVHNQSSVRRSQYVRNGDARGPVGHLVWLGYGYPGDVLKVRDLVLLTQ